MNTLAWNYYLLKIKPEKALEYAAKAFEKDKSIYISHTYATNLLWNNKIEDALKVSKIFFNDPKSFDDFYDDISDFLLLLIAKEAYKEAYELFSSPKNQTLKLKHKFKPLYFALMFYMKEEHPLEFLKMGSELKETVEEVIQKIEEKRLDYD